MRFEGRLDMVQFGYVKHDIMARIIGLQPNRKSKSLEHEKK